MVKPALIGCGVVMLWIMPRAGGLTAIAQSHPEVPTSLAHDRPSFEVASVRPAPEFRNALNYPAPHTPRARASGQFDATATLRFLIGWAFYNTPNTVAEGSFPELDDVFVVAAKADGPVLLTRPGTVGPMNLMLQSLLAQRFKLRVRWEPRSLPVSALRRTSAGQLGPNLKRLDPTCPESYPEKVLEVPDGCVSRLTTGRGQVKGFVSSMEDFAKFLSMFAGTRVVEDTGLVGPFELSTPFVPRSQSASSPFPAENLPTLRDALRHDLGLKLEAAGQRDFPRLVVEHVEQPTDN
jgi:uncharacterized protein (TIGR03435 family)